MFEHAALQELSRGLSGLDPSVIKTGVFLTVFMCIFVIGWLMKSLLQGGIKNFESRIGEEVDMQLTWAIVIVGFFMILGGFYFLFTGFN